MIPDGEPDEQRAWTDGFMAGVLAELPNRSWDANEKLEWLKAALVLIGPVIAMVFVFGYDTGVGLGVFWIAAVLAVWKWGKR